MSSPLWKRPALWIALGLTVAAATGVLLRSAKEPLPVLMPLRPFSLTAQDGKPFGSEQLRGTPFIANFIFTRCPTICPRFSGELKQIQDRTAGLGPRLRLVSITVDPEYDRPEVLAGYARRFDADPARWTFLTGDAGEVKATVLEGFKVAIGVDAKADAGDPNAIFHGTQFVLVDADQQIRGFYPSADPAAIERLIDDARALVP